MATSKLELAVGTGQWDAGLKKAQQALNSFTQSQGGLQQALGKDNEKIVQFVQMMGKIDSTANTAKGQLRDYRNSIEQLSTAFNSLSDAQKKGVEGQAITSALDSLKAKAMEAKQEVERLNVELSGSKFGKSGGIIDDIGHKMGVSANLTELLTSKTALMTAGIGAAVAAIYKGTEAWTKYNAELSKQDQQTQVITGLKGSGTDHMTDVMRAISDTYKVDFRQAVEAANTLMSQFGVSGSEAIQLIRDGMQGMIQGDGPKLLSMIQQYAPAFRDAGVSASQLVAVIHNSEGGIFTDQNMSAIVMGMKNIRLMTKQTSEALAKLGIDGNQMSQQLSNGSLTVFDALKQVASELKNVDSNSKTAGEVMQTVFGRQGAMAGTNLAKAIETLNTNLKETKKQTGELGDAFAELQTANEKLNTAIRDAFSYDGWEQMANGIKATLISTLADVIEKLGKIRDFVAPGGITTRRVQNRRVEGEVKDVQSATQGEGDSAKIKQQQILDKYDREIAAKRKELERARTETNDGVGAPYATTIRVSEKTKEDIEKEIKALQKMKEEFRQESNKVITTPSPVNTEPEKPKPDPNDPKTIIKSTTSATAKELNPMQQAQKEISALTEEALTADEARRKVIKEEIADLQKQVDEYKKIQDYVMGKGAVAQVSEAKVNRPLSVSDMIAQERDKMEAQQTALDSTTLSTLLRDSIQNNIDVGNLLDSANLEIQAGIDVPDETWQGIIDKYNELREQIGQDPININLKSGEEAADDGKAAAVSWKDAAKAVNTMGSALSHIPDPAAKIASTVAMSIANVAMAYSDALAKDVGSKFNIFGFIAAAAASMVSMATTIASIHSATGYAQGGIIEGNSYSGDNIGGLVDGSQFVGLNAGEVVLTKAMTSNLASQLQGSGSPQTGRPYVTGDKLVLAINNWSRSTGRGELIFSK